MLGNGDGTFRAATSFNAGSNPKMIVSADFNRDNSPDLAALNPGTVGNAGDPGGVSILMGNGTGSFGTVTSVAVGTNPRALAVGDVNGDNIPDLVTATGTQVSILLGRGDGTFRPAVSVPVPAGETPNTLAIVDIDADGSPDIVMGDCCSDASTVYYRGNGDGTFQPSLPFYGGNNVRSIVSGDWNGDGKADLLLGYGPANSNTVSAVAPLVNRLSAVSPLTVTSGASFVAGPIAPDSIVSVFGSNLTTGTAAATSDPAGLPTTLADTTVTIQDSQGTVRTAQLYYVSPTQINYLVPAATALGMARISVTSPNGVSTARVNVIATAPGIFTANSSGLAAATGVHVRGTEQSTFNVQYTDAKGQIQGLPINLGPRTDQVYLTLFGTGIRNRTSLEGVSVLMNGIYSPALYAGPQSEYSGLDQLNVQIPPSLSGAGKVTIVVSVNGVTANPVNVLVQ